MQSKTFIKALLQTSAITAVAMGTAMAQDAPQEESSADEIVVTGSRIKKSTFTSPVSMDVLTVEDAKIDGIADLSGLLQTATAASGSNQITSAVSTAFITNGGLGAETVGLRGLDARRTLDLINGRRAGPSGIRGAVASFDLNSIPLVGVERVDILKDGASSVYGSDAIAGVINYITDKSEGAEIDLYTQVAEQGGGEVFRGSATYGKVFDKGRFRATVDYIKEKELARGDRDYLDCNENYSFTDSSLTTRADVIDPRTGEPQCSGTIWGQIWVYDYGSDNLAPNPRNILLQYDYSGTLGNFIPGIPTTVDGSGISTPAGWFQVEYDQSHVPGNAAWAGIDVSDNGPNSVTDLYNPMQRRNSVTPEQERFTFMFDGDYEISDSVTAYGEALFNRRENYANGLSQYWSYKFGESAAVFGGGANPDPISAGWTGDNTWFSPTPVVEHGDSSSKIDYMRFVGGLKGDFSEDGPLNGWSWDVYGQHSNSDAEYTNQIVRADSIRAYNFETQSSCALGSNPVSPGSAGDSNLDGIADGDLDNDGVLDVLVDGRTCADVRWFDPAFLNGELTDAERSFLLDTIKGSTEFTQTTVEGYMTGDLFKVPAGSVSGAFGLFFQNDEINDTPSDVARAGLIFNGTKSGITTGSQESTAVYGEVSVPIVTGKKYFESLTVDASARFSSIKSIHEDGRSNTEEGLNYRLTADWQISPAIRARASHGTSFRAPGLFEQFLADEASGARQGAIDPCVAWDTEVLAGNITQTVADNCQTAGVPTGYAGGAVAATVLRGGGFGVVEPETSSNYTVGAVFTPEFADLSIAVDYFDITIKDEISTLGAGTIVANCYGSQDFANEPLCAFVTRGQPTNPIGIDVVQSQFININSQRNTGLDFTMRYGQDTKWGSLRVNSQFTRQLKDEIDLLQESQTNYLNGGIGEPKWTGFTNVTLKPNDKVSLRYGFNYIGKSDGLQNLYPSLNGVPPNPADVIDGVFTVPQDGQTVFWKTDVESVFYHNLSAEYAMESGWTFRFGIDNVFDEQPPASSSQSNVGNTPLVSQYDLLGRKAFLNISKKFN